VGFRGDDEALRARVDELETKLGDAQAEIARLRGERAESATGTRIDRSRVIGGPSRYAREVLVPHEIDEAGYEAIAAVLRQRLGLNASQVGRTLTVPNVFSLAREEGGVRIRLAYDASLLATRVIAAPLFTGAFGALMSGGLMADIVTHGVGWAHTVPVDFGIGAAAVGLASFAALGVGALVRRGTARTANEQLAAYEGTFQAILDLAEQHAVRVRLPDTRVAAPSDAPERRDEAAEAELEAVDAARTRGAPDRSA
jgi:hypothetical protein